MNSADDGPRIGSLCTGYGGLDEAVQQVFGGRTVWHADPGPGATAILAHHWPDVPNLGDISAVDWQQAEQVDVLTAGFPCQDVSRAGKRAGLKPGTRSGLWHEVARAIDNLNPDLVVIENVRGILSEDGHGNVEPCPWCVGDRGDEPVLRALGVVLGDLADLGFDAEWVGVPASAIGAAHERWREFIIAWPAAAHAGGTGLEVRPVEPDGHKLAASERGRGDAAGRRVGGRWASTLDRWARVVGRRPPRPVDDRGEHTPEFSEWLMGLPAGHVTGVPGLSREQQFVAIGNGVVVRQAAAALRLLAARAGIPSATPQAA